MSGLNCGELCMCPRSGERWIPKYLGMQSCGVLWSTCSLKSCRVYAKKTI